MYSSMACRRGFERTGALRPGLRMRKRAGYSILELLIVLSILGVATTIIRPRLSRASQSAPTMPKDVLIGELKALRGALLAYASEHRGRVPSGDAASVQRQLLQFSDRDGRTSPHRTATHRLGPYLSNMPVLPVGANRGRNEIVVMTGVPDPSGVSGEALGGWLYAPAAGVITANTVPGERDTQGQEYRAY